jgi:hypothetical protein
MPIMLTRNLVCAEFALAARAAESRFSVGLARAGVRCPPLEKCKHDKISFTRRSHSHVGEFRRNRAGSAAVRNGAARSAAAHSAAARGPAARSAPARSPAARSATARMAAVVLCLQAGGGAILRPSEAGRWPHSVVPDASFLQVAASLQASAPSGAAAVAESRKGAAARALGDRSLSLPRSSNRTRRFPVSGLPTGFIEGARRRPSQRPFRRV